MIRNGPQLEKNANNNKNNKHQICSPQNLYRKATRGKKHRIGSSSLVWTFLLAPSLPSILTINLLSLHAQQVQPQQQTTIQRSNKCKRSLPSQVHVYSLILSPKSKYTSLFTVNPTPHVHLCSLFKHLIVYL